MTTTTPRVWIGCLASYNAGRLIGEWTDATDETELQEAQERVGEKAIKAAKAAGEYPVYFGKPEEFMVSDYDGFPDEIARHLGEYPSNMDVARFATLIEERGLELVGAAAATLDDLDDLDSAWIDDHHRGEWGSEEDFAQSVVTEIGWNNVPAQLYPDKYGSGSTIDVFDELSSYINWESIARDMFRHGNYTYQDGHVFEDDV
jgi:antirestriction protein